MLKMLRVENIQSLEYDNSNKNNIAYIAVKNSRCS